MHELVWLMHFFEEKYRMGIEFKSLRDQINLLRTRNLSISQEDESKVKSLLLRSSYYDVVNGYGSFLQDSTNHFFDGSTFNELYSIYMYDKNIKSVFFRKIEKAESVIRASVSYHFSRSHKGKWSYLDSNNFKDDPFEVSKLMSKLSGIIEKQKRYKGTTIRHYMDTHNEVPLWVLVNFIDFGTLKTFFKLMKDTDKIAVVDNINGLYKEHYGTLPNLTPTIFESYLENINDVRNIVAHDNRLLKFKLRRNAKQNKEICHPYRNIRLDSVFHVYLSLKIFLSAGQYKNFTNALRNRTKDLKRDLGKTESKSDINDILYSIGFPKDWV